MALPPEPASFNATAAAINQSICHSFPGSNHLMYLMALTPALAVLASARIHVHNSSSSRDPADMRMCWLLLQASDISSSSFYAWFTYAKRMSR